MKQFFLIIFCIGSAFLTGCTSSVSEIPPVSTDIPTTLSPYCKWSGNNWIFTGYKNGNVKVSRKENSRLCEYGAELTQSGDAYLVIMLSGSILTTYPLNTDSQGRYWLGNTRVYSPEACSHDGGSGMMPFGAFDWHDEGMEYSSYDIKVIMTRFGSVGCYDRTTENKNLLESDNYGDKNGTYWIVPISAGPGVRINTKTGGVISGELITFPDGSQSSMFAQRNKQ